MQLNGAAERAHRLLLETVIVKAREASTRELAMMLWPFNELNRNALLSIAMRQAKSEASGMRSRAFERVE